MDITVDQMYQIENKGHDMGFLKKFMMENAGAAAVRRLITNFENISSKIESSTKNTAYPKIVFQIPTKSNFTFTSSLISNLPKEKFTV